MKKYKIDRKKLFLACLFSGGLVFAPSVYGRRGDAFNDGNKFVIEEYGFGKVELIRDNLSEVKVAYDKVFFKIGDVFIIMSKDDYDNYLDLAAKHDAEMPYYYLCAFGILSGAGLGTFAFSKVLKRRNDKR